MSTGQYCEDDPFDWNRWSAHRDRRSSIADPTASIVIRCVDDTSDH
ncbi:hypothetical protein [Halorubrum aidingense]|nr:hypothetical protein [Halorubrum aidingense]